MKTRIGRPLACLLTLLSLGCASVTTVDVTGTRTLDSPLPSHVTFAVLPTNEVRDDPAFPRYADMVGKELERRDYRRTDEKVANLGVFLAYGITDRSAKSASDAPKPDAIGASGGGMVPGGGTYGTPFGITGSSPYATRTHRYRTQLDIIVVDLAKSRTAGSLVELWRGETQTTGDSADLSRVAPMLITAALRHLGETTPKAMQHTFREDDNVNKRPSSQ